MMASMFDMHVSDLFHDDRNDGKLTVIRDELILHRAMFIAAEKYRLGITSHEEYKQLLEEYEKETYKLIDIILDEKK